jgi:hypothetical protein
MLSAVLGDRTRSIVQSNICYLLSAICYLLFAIAFELVGENAPVIATETVWPIRNGTGVSPTTSIRTAKRCGSRIQSIVGLITGSTPLLTFSDPSGM